MRVTVMSICMLVFIGGCGTLSSGIQEARETVGELDDIAERERQLIQGIADIQQRETEIRERERQLVDREKQLIEQGIDIAGRERAIIDSIRRGFREGAVEATLDCEFVDSYYHCNFILSISDYETLAP